MSPRCTVALLALGLLSACATPDVMTGPAGGMAVRAAVASQTAHPEAVRNANPVNGVDGAAALQAQQKYERSFSKSSPGADTGAPIVQGR
jgi:ABC-type amino acid transport substrate-binding protein